VLAFASGARRAPSRIAAVLFTLLAVVAATHDIAIDGYYLEALDSKAQSAYVGFRATAYKLAMLAVGGPIILPGGRRGLACRLPQRPPPCSPGSWRTTTATYPTPRPSFVRSPSCPG
jgi:hypothetical protein